MEQPTGRTEINSMQTKTLEDKHKKLNTRYLQNLLHILPIQLLKINQYQIKKKNPVSTQNTERAAKDSK